jgi:hypothetical protein
MDAKSFAQKSSKISPVVIENKEFLSRLARIKSEKKRRAFLKTASTGELLAIAEICLNIVKSRYPLTTRQKKRLLPYADFVRRLSRARSEQGARKVLVQQGSGAGSVFAALLTPILIELARGIINKQNPQANGQ